MSTSSWLKSFLAAVLGSAAGAGAHAMSVYPVTRQGVTVAALGGALTAVSAYLTKSPAQK